MSALEVVGLALTLRAYDFVSQEIHDYSGRYTVLKISVPLPLSTLKNLTLTIQTR